MPKIPTFTSKGTITGQGPSVTTNLQIPLTQTVGAALQPISKYVEQEYIKEKKLEENNKVDKLISNSYKDNQNGPVGFLTLSSETGKNPNPSDASNIYDQGVDKLYNFISSSKGQNLSRFGKQIFKSKFYGSASQLKANALLQSRKEQFKESSDVDSDYITQKTIALSSLPNGSGLDQIYNEIDIRLDSNSYYNEQPQLKNDVKQKYQQFSASAVANKMLLTQPELLKKQLQEGKYNILESKDIIELSTKADEVIKGQKFDFLLSDLKILDGKIGLDIINDFKGVKEGTFNGDVNKIKLFESLNPLEKKELIKLAETQRSKSNAEINNINSGIRYQFRDEAIQNSVRVYDSYRTKGIFNSAEINQVFGDYEDDINTSTKQQFIELSTKQGNNELTKISNYYKNDEITSQILNGKIKDISTPFILQGENKPLSILQRAGDGINTDVDLKFYIDYLLPNIKDPTFVDDNKEFFKFIQKYQPQIEGPTYSKYVDKNLDNRLNQFKNDMFKKFIERRRIAEPTKDLLSKDSKKFIGHDISSYLPTQGDIEKGILENFETEGEKKYPPKLSNETKDEYLKRIGL
tara:strand:+ start:136 stop:1872 length:1737 start_codon:yes stop_codon:yes gene_type:complete